MAEIVVVGGTGFIGAAVALQLVNDGHAVRVYSRSRTRFDQTFGAHSTIEHVAGELSDPEATSAAVAGAEHVLHFASTTNPAASVDAARDDVMSNVLDSLTLFDACVAASIRRLTFASTGGAIYGHYPGRPLHEDDATMPVSPYAIGKLATEGHLRYYHARHGLQSLALRISNPYGPRQNAASGQGVIAAFMDAAREGNPVTVFGDGGMVRDYLHIDDAARMIARTVSVDAPHAIVNVGSGVGHSVAEVLSLVERATGRSIPTDRRPARPSDVPVVVLDTERYAAAYGSSPTTTLADGIANVWVARTAELA